MQLGFGYREIPLNPPAFTAGITLTCVVPMTLGIGISLVRSAGGNEGLALFLTGGLGTVLCRGGWGRGWGGCTVGCLLERRGRAAPLPRCGRGTVLPQHGGQHVLEWT